VSEEFINEEGNNITETCHRYIGPLIKGEASIIIGKDGLPEYVRLAKKWVEKKLPRYL
jgi:6-phosphofructokinase 1